VFIFSTVFGVKKRISFPAIVFEVKKILLKMKFEEGIGIHFDSN
jgi:hypothetical protein